MAQSVDSIQQRTLLGPLAAGVLALVISILTTHSATAQLPTNEANITTSADADQFTNAQAAQNSFLSNYGQLRDQFQRAMPEVKFYSTNGSVTTYFTQGSEHFVFRRFDNPTAAAAAIQERRHSNAANADSILSSKMSGTLYRADMHFVGATTTSISGQEQQDEYTNYYSGVFPDGLLRVPQYRVIVYKDLYPHIDLLVRLTGGQSTGTESSFIVHPGGDPNLIRMQYDDREHVVIRGDGSLYVSNPYGELTEAKPVSSQDRDDVESAFRLRGNVVSYQIGSYDTSRDLVIDPPRMWSTYYGGANTDVLWSVATDHSGNVYGAGATNSYSGIATTGAFNTAYSYNQDAFVVMLNSAGVRQWGTYIGENGDDVARGIAVDYSGNIVVAGHTKSTVGISTAGAYQTSQSYPGYEDCFIMKFNSSGARQWGTYYGSSNRDLAYAVGVDVSNNVYIGGTWNGYPNSGSAFIAKFNSTGTSLTWATQFTGTGSSGDAVLGICVDSFGIVHATGLVTSTGSFSTPGVYQTSFGGNWDAFVAAFTVSGSVQWCSYYGGSGYDQGQSIAYDVNGYVYAGGVTSSTSGMSTTVAHQTVRGSGWNAFLSKWSNTGSLVWGTYYGASGTDWGYGVAVDRNQDIILAGSAASTTAIATTGEYQTTNSSGSYSAFLAKFNSSGVRQWGTYYGSTVSTDGYAVAIDSGNNIILAGQTDDNTGALSTSGVHQTSSGGGTDAYIAKFCGIATPAISSSTTSLCQGTGITLTAPAGYSAYQWKLGGTDISGATSNSYAVPNNLSVGVYNYTLNVSNTSGCSITSLTKTITVHANPTAVAGAARSICAGTSTVIGGSATGGQSPYTYQWSPAGSLDDATLASPRATPTTTTTYSVIVTDANGCQNNASVTVTVNPTPALSFSRTVETCLGTAIQIGNAATSGLAPYAYSWSPAAGLSATNIAQPSANPTALTKYFVTVTDAHGCQVSDSVQVTVNPVPQVSVAGAASICLGSSSNLVASAVGGTGAITYLWSPSTGLSSSTISNPVATPTTSITYQVTITDAKGCSNTASYSVTVNKHPVPVLAASAALDLCDGDSLTLSVPDPYQTYLWSSGSSASTLRVGQGGDYYLMVTDANGCDGTSNSVHVTLHLKPNGVIAGPPSACPNSTSSYGLNYLTNPQNPIRFRWKLSGGGTMTSLPTDSACNIQWSTVGSWKLTLTTTDMVTGCSSDTSLLVTVNAVLTPTVSVVGSTTVCQGDSVVLSAPTGYTSYLWSSGETTRSITVRKSGSYTVQVVGTGGCSGSSAPIVVQALSIARPSPTITSSGTTFCEGDSLLLTASSGFNSYQWSNGSTNPTIFAKSGGTYSVTVTNSSGCHGDATVTLTMLPSAPLAITSSGPNTFCEGSTLLLTATPGFSSYRWNTGATTQTLSVTSSGTYSVTVTNANGCAKTSLPVAVNVIAKPAPVIAGPSAVCANSRSTYTIPAVVGHTTNWLIGGGAIQSGQGTNTIVVQWGAAGTGTVNVDETVTAVGCVGSAPKFDVAIGTSLKPLITFAGPHKNLCDALDSVILDAGLGYANYTWSTGEKTQRIRVVSAGSYDVSVDDGAGCSGKSDAVVIVSSQAPTPTLAAGGPLSFCEGDSVTLSAGSGYASYAWSIDGVTIPGAVFDHVIARQAGSYLAIVKNAAGCEGPSNALAVVVNAIPARPSISLAGGLLNSTPASAYQWSLAGVPIPGATAQTLNASIPGDYTVTILDQNGCSNTSLPYILSNGGTTVIALPALIYAPQSEHIVLPLTIASSANLPQGVSRDYVAVLRFNKTLLIPSAGMQSVVRKNDLIVTVRGSTSATSGVIQNLDFTAALGNDSCTVIYIDSFAWLSGSVASTMVNGEFCLTDLCQQGGTRLIEPEGTFTLGIARPNPASDAVQIDYEILENAHTDLIMLDLLGHVVQHVVDADQAPGKYSVVADIRSLKSGNYLYQLSSGMERKTRQIQIIR